MKVDYRVIDPTGNITILVETPVVKELQPQMAEALLALEKRAEQVGYVNFPDDISSIESSGSCSSAGAKGLRVGLRMAGGEFCGNASMSAAALLCGKSGIETGGNAEVMVSVSGAADPVRAEIKCEAPDHYVGRVEMPVPSGPVYLDLDFNGTGYTLPMISFEGISHLIAEKTPEDMFGSRKNAGRALKKWAGELDCPSLGIMFFDKETCRIDPLVYVKDPGTLYWESSCASGTTATGVYAARKWGHMVSLEISEPGGVLTIEAAPEGNPVLTGHITMGNPVEREIEIS